MRRIFGITLFLATLATLSARAVDLDSLLLKSVGGTPAIETLEKMTSLQVEGTVRMNDMVGRFTEVYLAPDKFYLEVDFGGFRLVQGYDGNTAWQKDQNDRVAELTGMERRELLKNLYFESYSYLFSDRLPGSIEYQGETDLNGETYHRVAFYPFDTDTVIVYYDLETGLKEVTTSHLDDMKSYVYAELFDTIAGVVFPASTRTITEGVPITTEFEIETIELNKQVPDGLFSRPFRSTTDFYFPPGKDRVEIPIEYSDGHLRIEATINGEKKARFILDTGASANMLHLPVIDGMDIPKVGALPVRGISGYDEAALVQLDSLSIGELTLYGQVAGTLDLAAVAGRNRGPFGGLLGYDFLSRFPILIDYEKSQLTVFNPNGFTPPAGGIEVPFSLTLQTPTVTCELAGVKGEFIVDLGNALGLLVHNRFYESNRLDTVLQHITNHPGFGGVGGKLSGRMAEAESFRMGDVDFGSVSVILPSEASGMSRSGVLAGNIGNPLLEHFRVLFDYNSGRIILYQADN